MWSKTKVTLTTRVINYFCYSGLGINCFYTRWVRYDGASGFGEQKGRVEKFYDIKNFGEVFFSFFCSFLFGDGDWLRMILPWLISGRCVEPGDFGSAQSARECCGSDVSFGFLFLFVFFFFLLLLLVLGKVSLVDVPPDATKDGDDDEPDQVGQVLLGRLALWLASVSDAFDFARLARFGNIGRSVGITGVSGSAFVRVALSGGDSLVGDGVAILGLRSSSCSGSSWTLIPLIILILYLP